MNVYFVLNGITFIWDDEKVQINPTNHDGVTFQQAAVIGLDTRWNLLYVVHIEREENAIRIISARKATCQERLQYED
jgi:uncharacterized protein